MYISLFSLVMSETFVITDEDDDFVPTAEDTLEIPSSSPNDLDLTEVYDLLANVQMETVDAYEDHDGTKSKMRFFLQVIDLIKQYIAYLTKFIKPAPHTSTIGVAKGKTQRRRTQKQMKGGIWNWLKNRKEKMKQEIDVVRNKMGENQCIEKEHPYYKCKKNPYYLLHIRKCNIIKKAASQSNIPYSLCDDRFIKIKNQLLEALQVLKKKLESSQNTEVELFLNSFGVLDELKDILSKTYQHNYETQRTEIQNFSKKMTNIAKETVWPKILGGAHSKRRRNKRSKRRTTNKRKHKTGRKH